MTTFFGRKSPSSHKAFRSSVNDQRVNTLRTEKAKKSKEMVSLVEKEKVLLLINIFFIIDILRIELI